MVIKTQKMTIIVGNNIDRNILNKLFNKALSKPKTQSFWANLNGLSMHD